jgi:multicomponent Na+:H+ antiporter subunit D
MQGLGRRMPWTFGAFALASLSFMGLPPVAGFVSKFYMVTGAVDADMTLFIGAILLTSLLNLAYLGPVVYKAFFLAPAEGVDISQYAEAPRTMVIPMMAAAIISLLLGIYPQAFLNFVDVFGGF